MLGQRMILLGAGLMLAALAATPRAQAQQDVVAERRQAFILADTNHDGCVDLAELAHATALRFAALDRDHDGKLSKEELQAADAGAFARVDRDADGSISFLEVMTVKEVDFAKADKTKRGCVLVDEVIEFDGVK